VSAWLTKSWRQQKRGATAVIVVVTLPALLGFAALTVDVGLLQNAKADLQRAVDAAALAGASAYFSDTALRKDDYELTQLVTGRSQAISLQNPTLGRPTILEAADILVGRHDFDNPSGPLLYSGSPNAVHATARRVQGGANGPVPFIFAPLWGVFHGDVTASARAATSDHFAGLQIVENAYPVLLPFTIDKDLWDDQVASGPDQFSYDDDNGTVDELADGISEAHLFPIKIWGEGQEYVPEDDEGAGNFGLVNIAGSGSASQVGYQIENGISADEMEAEFGGPELLYSDEQGNAITHQISGTPGITASIKSSLEQRVGDVVGFFIHDTVTGVGSGTCFRNVGIRFGRIMNVKLTGNPKGLVIQPVAYAGPAVIVHEAAPPTGGQVGCVMLVQ
jgi:hypothetical protein